MKILTKKTPLKREFKSGSLPVKNNEAIGNDIPLNYEIGLDSTQVVNLIAENIPSLNYGDVYYISAASGNNSTAEKGNPEKPYATFAAVAALYQNGEIIHILDGTISASGVIALNSKTSIKIILEKFTTLQNFSYTPTTTGYNASILGNGVVSGGTVTSNIAVTGTYTVNVDTIYNHKIVNKGGTFNFFANIVEFISNGSVLHGDSVTNNNIKEINIIANTCILASETINQFGNGASATITNSTINLNAKTLQLNGTGFNVIWDINVSNVSLNFKADVWKSNANYLMYWQGNGRNFENCAVNVYIGYYKGPASLFGDWGPGEHSAGQGLNSSYKIKADFYHCTKSTGSILKHQTTNDRYSNYFFEIDGFFVSDTVPVLRLTEAMAASYLFKGVYKTTAAVPAFNLTTIGASARLNLENAKFIVASGQKVVEATGASNVYCMNVVTNSTTTDAEVTEVGQAIVRNAAFV